MTLSPLFTASDLPVAVATFRDEIGLSAKQNQIVEFGIKRFANASNAGTCLCKEILKLSCSIVIAHLHNIYILKFDEFDSLYIKKILK